MEELTPSLHFFAAENRSDLVEAIQSDAKPPATNTFPARLALIAEDAESLRQRKVEAVQLLQSKKKERFSILGKIFFHERDHSVAPKVAWLFPGYGAQYPGMLQGVPDAFPAAASWIGKQTARAQSYFQTNPWLLGTSGATEQVAAAEQAYAILLTDVIFSEVLHSIGVPCHGVIGHSYGESAALYSSGAVSNPWKAIGLARRIFEESNHHVSPCAFLTARGDVAQRMCPPLEVALENCPSQSVLCGSPEAVSEAEKSLHEDGELVFRIGQLDQPVHTSRFSVTPAEYQAVYDSVEFNPSRVPLYSCVTGLPLPPESAAMKQALIRQWHETVRFQSATESLYQDGYRIFLEAGPAGRLSGFVRDTLRGKDVTVLSCDHPKRAADLQMREVLARLYCAGVALSEEKIAQTCRMVSGPSAILQPTRSKPSTEDHSLEIIRKEMAQLLGSEELPHPDQGFFDSGLGSIEVVELASRLSAKFATQVSPVQVFEESTPRRLSESLSESNGGENRKKRTRPSHEPIAIVGMSCRIPGGIDSPEQLWSLLESGADVIGDIPTDRWNPDQWPDAPRKGGFLADLRKFDSQFFGISAREAAALDPQQRLLLEMAWEAFENSLINPRSLRDSNTAVYTGISGSEYSARLSPNERLQAGGYLATGCMPSTAAGRVSHFLGLRGPSLAVDTACSSSLVAVDLAVQALRSGTCDRALAGGVNVLLSPELSIHLNQSGALSPDGHCKTFDAQADGYVRSEGGGLIVLKRLSDAIEDQDRIHAVIRGSAVDHNGTSSGLTVPSSKAQALLIRNALDDAGITADQIQCIEAHGTGTKLGDPIEAAALGSVFSTRKHPLRIGSIKTQIGHLEAGAGIAGVLKMVLQLSFKKFAPSLHFSSLNPAIDWPADSIQVCTELTDWKSGPHPRLGGVSSFGISGTNAHLILEEPPAPPTQTSSPQDGVQCAYTVSAGSPASLSALIRNHRELLSTSEDPIQDLAASTRSTRSSARFRRAVIGDDAASIASALDSPGLAPASKTGVAFLFPGQGTGTDHAIRELYQNNPTFRHSFDSCRQGFSPLGLELDPHSPQKTPRESQAALFAFEYSLAQVWIDSGVQPTAVAGHSLGEYAAAVIAGVLRFEDACRLVCVRAQLIEEMGPPGSMLAVSTPKNQIEAVLSEHSFEVDIGAINAPSLTVVSGSSEEITQLRSTLRTQRISSILLSVDFPFHSRWMSPVAKRFQKELSDLPIGIPRIPFYSGMSGNRVDRVPAEYWSDQLPHTVRFLDCAQSLIDSGHQTFLEVGPGNTLCHLGLSAREDAPNLAWIAGPPNNENAWQTVLHGLCSLYERGETVDWTLFPPHFGRRVPLPNTVWDRQYHWISSQFEDECSADAIDQGNSRPDPNPLSPIIERFEEATNGRERRKIAALYLRYLCNGILGNPPETEIPTSTRFLAMGFDSMMATILRLRIHKDFGIDLPAPWIIETGTPDDCTDRIIRESTGTSRPGSKEPKTSTGTGAAENYPLSVGQSALWFLQKLHPTSTAYNQSIPLRIQKGTLEDWKRACLALVERHEILRTIYPESQESPVARILSSSVPDFTTQTFPDGRSVERAIAREHHQPFSLSDTPPVRFRWLCGPENDPILLITLHHIACDGWSNEIIQRDLAALARGESLDPVAFSYEQFSREQSALLSSERGADLLRRWREILADPIPVLDLGADYARVSDSAAKGEILSIPLAPSLTSKLRDFARENESTLQNTILAAFASLLQTLSRQNDCIIGCPVAAREAPELTETVGYFVNPLPIRIRMDGHTTFREFIAIAQTAMKRSLELQDYPFPQLVKDLNAPRIPGRSPIFDASFNFVRTLGQRHEELESFSIPQAAGKFDLTLNVVENGRHPSFSFAYRADLFRTDTIERFGLLLTQIIDAGITAPEMSVGEALSHSIQDDQRSLISGAESPITRTVIDDLFQWAKATPSQIALVAGERSITYGELGRQVLSWARWLQSEGVRAEVPVAIIANRTAETWIAYLGILASGGTLLPLDPQAPAAGRKEILQRTTPPLLLAENANAFSGIPARTVEILNGPPVTDSESPWTPPTLAGTAYILFTSGSTGTPKGVSVGHSALANYAASLQEILQTHPGAHFGHISPLTTDLGHSAWVGALTTGGCLHLIPDRVRLHPSLFAAYIKDHPLDYLKSTPSHCSALLEPNGSGTVEDFPIKSFILGGERVSSEWLARIKELGSECSIIHHYGPTEATIGVLVANLNSHDNVSTKALPLRRPTLNTTIALVNETGCVVPRGVCGELTISGLCLSDGYIDGTTTSPGPLELSQITENGVYRTGDLARMSLNGDIEIIGRLDRQLKLHGIRIEPGHLEALLQQLSSVSDSRIFIHGDQICACIVSQDPHGVEVAGEHLKRHLPPSLVPTRWYQCEQLPLTRNGKLDTDALTETRSFSTEPKNRGQDPLMATVLRIWKDALQRPELRSDENFFDAGGHSLLAIRLLALLFEQTGHTLSIADLLNHPTAEKTSAFLRAKGSEPSITVPVVQLKDGRGPLQILIPGAGGSLLYFQPLLEKISEGPVIGLPGLIGHKNTPKSVGELASYYLENLSPEQLDQPIALLGHSFGGLLAWALADRLQASGATVRHVGIIDNPAVGSGKGREYTSWDHVDWLRHIALRIGKLHGTTLQLPESINRELSPEESDRSFAAHLRDHGFLPQGTSDQALAQYIRTYRANALAAALYEPARIKNPPFQLHLFLAADHDHELDEDRSEMSEWLGWEKVYPRSPHLYTLPGTHLSLLAEPNVERLAAEWNKLIAPHPHGR